VSVSQDGFRELKILARRFKLFVFTTSSSFGNAILLTRLSSEFDMRFLLADRGDGQDTIALVGLDWLVLWGVEMKGGTMRSERVEWKS
jgi:hypothetical protein